MKYVLFAERKRRREKGKNKEVDDEAEYFLDEEDEKPGKPLFCTHSSFCITLYTCRSTITRTIFNPG